MRAIFVLCTLVGALFGFTSVTFAQCTQIPEPVKAQKAGHVVRGFVPVQITFTADKTDAVKKAESVTDLTFRFWIQGRARVLYDREGFVKQVHECIFGNGVGTPKDQKTYVKFWYRKAPSDSGDEHGVSYMYVSSDVVAKKPMVGIVFESGTELRGQWGQTTVRGRKLTTLAIAPVE